MVLTLSNVQVGIGVLIYIPKNHIKLLKKSIVEWKTKTKTKTLPTGSGAEKIVHYVQIAFHDVMRKKYDNDDKRREAIMAIFDHLNEHKTGLCVNRDGSASSKPNHIHLDPSLASHLKTATAKYCDHDAMEHIKLLDTTNQLESLNHQMAAIQPKFIMRKNPLSYDSYSITVALKSKLRSNILRKILIKTGLSNDMIPPIIVDNQKANNRYHVNEQKTIARRGELKRNAKTNDNNAKKFNNTSLGSYKNF